jgi:hypothetical protein
MCDLIRFICVLSWGTILGVGCARPYLFKAQPGGREYALTFRTQDHQSVGVLKCTSDGATRTFSVEGRMLDFTVDARGETLALYLARSWKDMVAFVSLSTLHETHAWAVAPPSCSGKKTCSTDHPDIAIDNTGSVLATFYYLSYPGCCTLGIPGKDSVSAVTLWDASTGKALREIIVPPSIPIRAESTYIADQYGLKFSPDDKYLAVFLSYTPGPKFFVYSMEMINTVLIYRVDDGALLALRPNVFRLETELEFDGWLLTQKLKPVEIEWVRSPSGTFAVRLFDGTLAGPEAGVLRSAGSP